MSKITAVILTTTQMDTLLDEEIPEFEMTLRLFFANCIYGLYEDESFSGKRPGVDSGWQHVIAAKLGEIDENVGKHNEYGGLDDINWQIVGQMYEQIIHYALGIGENCKAKP